MKGRVRKGRRPGGELVCHENSIYGNGDTAATQAETPKTRCDGEGKTIPKRREKVSQCSPKRHFSHINITGNSLYLLEIALNFSKFLIPGHGWQPYAAEADRQTHSAGWRLSMADLRPLTTFSSSKAYLLSRLVGNIGM